MYAYAFIYLLYLSIYVDINSYSYFQTSVCFFRTEGIELNTMAVTNLKGAAVDKTYYELQ